MKLIDVMLGLLAQLADGAGRRLVGEPLGVRSGQNDVVEK